MLKLQNSRIWVSLDEILHFDFRQKEGILEEKNKLCQFIVLFLCVCSTVYKYECAGMHTYIQLR